MNTTILATYGLQFRLLSDNLNNKRAIVFGNGTNPIISHIQNYLMSGNYIEFFEEEIIPEINKAISGLPFDSDGGGENAFLTIGSPLSFLTLNNGFTSGVNIPTTDIKEIILSWIEYLSSNNLEH